MQIFVKTLSRTLTLEVKPNETIEAVKQMILAKEDLPVDMRIIFGGKQLEDDAVLSQMFVGKEST
eukprot:CAMPEP_0184998358 /NCGR_PEP_ID=MMETSP1098-20130426/62119_1 /TAXON_ID=89044 /ORGANISM="Spumella elongata, Strain CCAP 955/1" /LENGTH=64 /DNA_ID=CAMNT_0027525145 /DNA_START=44 /DNA_END=235 /DNA_ORIENTATION=+